MNEKTTLFNKYIHYLIYITCAFVYSTFIGFSMADDGLRHIAFAANNDSMISWENVYPKSLFTSYDPWFAWHYLLEFLLNIISYEFVHIFINTFSLSILMILIHSHISINVKYNFSSLLYIIVFIITLLTSSRYIMVRPDLLSGLYVMTALLFKDRFRYIFILTILYAPFYYLFFIYTGSIGLVYLIQKKFRAFIGVFAGSLLILGFFLIHNNVGYIDTIFNILSDQKLRMGLSVPEGVALFEILNYFEYSILLPVFLLVSLSIIYWKYNYFKNSSLSVFLLITAILWCNQLRYYYLFLPMIYITIFIFFVNLNKKSIFYLLRKYYTIIKKYFNYSKNKFLFYIIAIPYSIFMLSYIFSNQSLESEVKKGEFYDKEMFNNKTILFNTLTRDLYRAHYYNASLKMVPSCSIGWFENDDKEMKDIYVRLQSFDRTITEDELYKLIKFINADYYIHFMINGKQSFDFNKLMELGIYPFKIIQKKIIFKVKK